MGLAWVSGQLRELWLEGGDVLVPSIGVRVLLDLWCLLELLEALDVGLGWAIAVRMSARKPQIPYSMRVGQGEVFESQRCAKARWKYSFAGS